MRTQTFLVWLAHSALLLALLPPARAQAGTDVAEPFRAYYEQHQGMRLLGYPLTGLMEIGGYQVQYFEKGRLEDHRAELNADEWRFMYGRLAAELMERAGWDTLSSTSLSYADIGRHHQSDLVPAPPGFSGGAMHLAAGTFIPYDPQLRPAYGYIVPAYFWEYITRDDLFVAGWLHDIGLPITGVLPVSISKNGKLRNISVQAFERTVLTYDSQNPTDWRVERANIGADAVRRLPSRSTIEIPAANARVTLPIHLLARVGRPGETVSVRLSWEHGGHLVQPYTLLRGEDGRGLLIGLIDLPPEYRSQQPWTQSAQLEINTGQSVALARQAITVLHPDDPDARTIKLYWAAATSIEAQLQPVAVSSAPEEAALAQLLWGPRAQTPMTLTTELPTPAQVLAFPGRAADWGPRVTVRSFRLADGIATVDFSKEMAAYGGQSLRASRIHAQITRTLQQFPAVRSVLITIEGQRDLQLEP